MTVSKCKKCNIVFEGTVCPWCHTKSNQLIFDADDKDAEWILGDLLESARNRNRGREYETLLL